MYYVHISFWATTSWNLEMSANWSSLTDLLVLMEPKFRSQVRSEIFKSFRIWTLIQIVEELTPKLLETDYTSTYLTKSLVQAEHQKSDQRRCSASKFTHFAFYCFTHWQLPASIKSPHWQTLPYTIRSQSMRLRLLS